MVQASLPDETNSNSFDHLKDRIITRNAKVCVVGLGYVGLPFAVEKAKAGFKVIGIEQNPTRAEQVNQGDSYIDDITSDELKAVVDSGHLKASTVFQDVQDADVIVICVPTPLTKNLTPGSQLYRRCHDCNFALPEARSPHFSGIYNLSGHHG